MTKTVSLSTAKLLKEMGWTKTCHEKEILDKWGIIYKPNTDELLDELPSTVDKTPIGSIGKCFLQITKWDDGYYYSSYRNPKIHDSSCGLVGYRDKEVVETLAQCWIWLKKEGLLGDKSSIINGSREE